MRSGLLVAFTVVRITVATRPVAAAPAADVVLAWSPTSLGPIGVAIADAANRAGASYVDASPKAIQLPDPRPLIKSGIAAYQALDFEVALTALDRAATIVDQTGAAFLDTTTLGDLFLYRALTHVQRNDDPLAWNDLVLAAGIDPTRKHDPSQVPPRAIERFAQASALVLATPRGRVRFGSGAAGGCVVRTDGAVVVGTEIDLPFGRHWLDATCDGREPVRRQLAVDRTAFEVAIAGPEIKPPEDATLVIQGRAASARAIVVVTIHGRAVVVRRLGIDGKEQDRASVSLHENEPRDRSAASLADDARRVGMLVARVLAPPARVATSPWYRSPWLWATAGVVITGAVLIPLAVRAGGEPPSTAVRPEGVRW